MKNAKSIVIISLLCFAIIMIGTFLKPGPKIINSKEEFAELLTDDHKNKVEDLYQSYLVLNRKVDILRTSLANPQLDSLDLDASDKVMKRTYYVVKSDVRGMNYVISETVLKPEDYMQLSEILYDDDNHTLEVSQRVVLKCVTDSERNDSVLYLNSNNQNVSISKTDSVLVLTVIGENNEKS